MCILSKTFKIPTDIDKFYVCRHNHFYVERLRVGMFLTKTLYYFDKDTQRLYARRFNIFDLIARLIFGVHKEFNMANLKDWLLSKNFNIQLLAKRKNGAIKTSDAMKALRNLSKLKRTFIRLVNLPNLPDEKIIALFRKGLTVNTCVGHYNERPLKVALEHNRSTLVKYLQENGARMN